MVRVVGAVEVIHDNGKIATVIHPYDSGKSVRRKMHYDRNGEYVTIDGRNWRLR